MKLIIFLVIIALLIPNIMVNTSKIDYQCRLMPISGRAKLCGDILRFIPTNSPAFKQIYSISAGCKN